MDSRDDSLFESHDLQGRILLGLRSAGTKSRLLQILREGFDTTLAGEVAVAGGRDRERHFSRIIQALITEILADLEAGAD